MQEAYGPPRSHSNSLLFQGGGDPSTKIFFSSLNMYQAKSGVKIFSLYHGGVPQPKIFFPSLNMYQAKSGVKIFSLYHGEGRGGPSTKNFFFQFEHVSSQIWCQKFFPLPVRGEGFLDKKFFFATLNMYQAKSGVKIFSLCRWWWWGGSLNQKFFFQSEHVSSQIWCQKIFPLPWGVGVPQPKIFFPV